MATFREPHPLPQDLLLISEFVDVPEGLKQPRGPAEDDGDDIASSDSDKESEEEIEKVLTALPEHDEEGDGKLLPSDSSLSSHSEDSDSESEPEELNRSLKPQTANIDVDDEDDTIVTTTTHPQTKNEVSDATIIIPELEEVGKDEYLEKVGEVMSIVDNIAIVKGLPSESVHTASERALDSDTLLVFEDRNVLGYVYETFGPTSQPLYQVRFSQTYPLDLGKVRIGREVFHVPQRSHFVFVRQLKQFKGSDASNVHDEEPAEDELEFSDDEAEAAYRSRLKRKRGQSRARSTSSSRHSTPSLSQMRDQDMMDQSVLNNGPFDEYGPYDLDYGDGPSRPAPKPYDNPYSDTYNAIESESLSSAQPHTKSERAISIESRNKNPSHTNRGSRGRGRGRGRGTNVRGTFNRGNHYPQSHIAPVANDEEYDPRMPHGAPSSPYLQGNNYYGHRFTGLPQNMNAGPTWGYPNQTMDQNYQLHMFPGVPYQTPQSPAFVQPHINPRFASAFGLGVPLNTSPYTQGSPGLMTPPPPVTPPRSWMERPSTPAADPAPPEEQSTS